MLITNQTYPLLLILFFAHSRCPPDASWPPPKSRQHRNRCCATGRQNIRSHHELAGTSRKRFNQGTTDKTNNKNWQFHSDLIELWTTFGNYSKAACKALYCRFPTIWSVRITILFSSESCQLFFRFLRSVENHAWLRQRSTGPKEPCPILEHTTDQPYLLLPPTTVLLRRRSPFLLVIWTSNNSVKISKRNCCPPKTFGAVYRLSSVQTTPRPSRIPSRKTAGMAWPNQSKSNHCSFD